MRNYRIRFLYASIGEVTCNAIVRRTAAKGGVAVEFMNLTDQDQQRLGALATLGIN